MNLNETRLESLLSGRAKDYTRPGIKSAIDKKPLPGPTAICSLGIIGDEQGDTRIHGGPDKAIHHYPRDHYKNWLTELGPLPILHAPGAFGENFSTSGWTEGDVCYGDIIQAGTALLEISQGRLPCWKLNDRFGVPDMALRVQSTGRSGWYYRVISEGIIKPGDSLKLVERCYPNWSIRRVLSIFFGGCLEPDQLHECLELPLVFNWRRTLTRRLETGMVEDWNGRLYGN
ncbi:MOSC domain-containing protein [Pseudomonas caricapapayae]|uniref:MOSC domain-containing protein n=1 Tax=Pseudomonas caricapapayae TaxID=46678 RepID=UPI000EFEB92C|nr:MOSC domain-containing protein [Pseudomonas caricapapayae]